MKHIVLDTAHCPQNHPCPAAAACPAKALTQKGYRAPALDIEKCVACGKCVIICPMSVFRLEL